MFIYALLHDLLELIHRFLIPLSLVAALSSFFLFRCIKRRAWFLSFGSSVLLAGATIPLFFYWLSQVLPDLDGPTKRPVALTDIAGTWRYNADFGATAITLQLEKNGTFIQTVNLSGKLAPIRQFGTWKLQGSSIELEEFLMKEIEGWKVTSRRFDIVDTGRFSKGFSILGGADLDPDGWQHLERLH